MIQGGHATEKTGINKWRDYTEIYKALVGKCTVYAYSPTFKMQLDDPLTKHYEKLGVHIRKFTSHELIMTLGRHTWNLVGNWSSKGTPVAWDFILPNKFFDAIAAGVPSVSIGCPMVEALIKKHDIGIAVKTPNELIKRWDEHKEKRKNLMLHRKKYCMEKYIGALIDLYEEVLDW